MSEDDLKGEELLAEASKVFKTPGASPTQPDAETPATPPPAPPSDVRPDDIKGEDDLFREANRILGE